MKLSVARESYYAASGTASTVARQAALAGIAIVWIFSAKTADGYSLPRDLMIVVFVLVLMLLFDLLHYMTQAIVWGSWARFHEKKLPHRLDDDPDVKASPYMNWPIHFFFVGKLLLLLTGYLILAAYVWRAVKFVAPHP